MSATSGIGISQELVDEFSNAVDTKVIRFIKVSIQNESLVHDESIQGAGTFQDDLAMLQNVVEDNTPAYILGRLDDPPAEWIAISYVPDSAKVRDKMLYASTRASLMKSLGSTLFTDSLFATSKDDLTTDSYAAHRRHVNAPKPLSAREQEMEDIKAAEREASGGIYEGSRARKNHLGNDSVGMKWEDGVTEAIEALGAGQGCSLLVFTINVTSSSEKLHLHSSSDITVDQLRSSILPSDPCFALFAWPRVQREIYWIYSCPSNSPVKNRMLYSSCSLATFLAAKALLSSYPTSTVASRKIETSDPQELDEAFLVSYLDLDTAAAAASIVPSHADTGEKKPFARPRGPGRR
ncbi:actin-binding proteins ADF family protein [Pleurotus pulmonarius]|nr:Twinfilin-1 [Pleurotus pulmonarius]